MEQIDRTIQQETNSVGDNSGIHHDYSAIPPALSTLGNENTMIDRTGSVRRVPTDASGTDDNGNYLSKSLR